MNRVPLAERMRPQKLTEVLGQEDIIGDGKILTEIVKNGEPVNLIFWGPPGTGKTTLARILAREFKADFVEISAVTAGKKDVEEVVSRAKVNWNLKTRTILFVDEIHRFNKAQQDAFLPHVESGLIILIGATTENPSFEVISPLLSRSRVVVVSLLSKDAILEVLKRALKAEKATKRVTKRALELLAELSGGDARSALGDLELALSLAEKIDEKVVLEAAGKKVPGYDKKGDKHYDTISAFIKSMRGNDVDAALYYLARMVQAGEDPKFIARRMVIFASEDIGLAGNGALSLATACFQAVERVGMPESGLILAHVVVALTKSKKSRATTDAWYEALDLAKKTPNEPVPTWLRNAPTKLMKDLGYGAGQKWEAGFHLDKNYLPDSIKNEKIFGE
ncbi:replication-associated recombination protein A [Candidatus Nanosyncoccus alces]|uniref:Replication-associated recombination protein A n=1 Tax=Candidatus Nanosyncoccus alces TaxID=2171997 RepID=A0ABY0FQ04_9BACT|nr:replication-associated recombination protein A [Candidatus Nanosyncoccus alces]RYC75147.1 Replication-associated recombination protein A [Candidatus Nanosyncoccus alces]